MANIWHLINLNKIIWCKIVDNRIIDLHFIHGTLNFEKYVKFLTEVLPILLKNVLLHIEQSYYQHDGCPAHSVRSVSVI